MRRKSIWPAVLLLILALSFAAGVFAYYRSRQNSREGMMRKATECAAAGNYGEAVRLLDRALSIPHDGPPSDERLYLLKAEYLEKSRSYDEALSIAMRVVKNSAVESQEYEDAWRRIVSVCRATGTFDKLAALLEGCENDALRHEFADYYCAAPKIGAPSGHYRDQVSITVTSDVRGTIFYTIDGSEPDEHSTLYKEPVVLPPGTYTFQAVLVNLYGVHSRVVSESYQVVSSDD